MSFSLHHFIHTHETDKEKHDRLHKKRYVRFIDRYVFIVAIGGPLTTIPQIMKIWISKDAHDISATTWALFVLSASIWLFYGIAHRNKPIIISNLLWVFLEGMVLLGAIIY